MLFIFEMANNHQGSVLHGKKIIDVFSSLSKKYKIESAVKLQFRHLDSFIHKDFKGTDVKHIKRFEGTKLDNEQFRELVNHIKNSGLKTAVTPFDNASLDLIEELGIDIVKIASCSADDWPLLKEAAKMENKQFVISTGGASIDNLKKVYKVFKSKNRNFSFLHCVSEYPTGLEHSNLIRIKTLKKEFPDIDIGFSTHEPPEEDSLVPYAISMGAKIVEKHVGVETSEWPLNKYSCNPSQIEKLFVELNRLGLATHGKAKDDSVEKTSLNSLKRGVFLKRSVKKGSKLTEEDLYYAMPVLDGGLSTAHHEAIIGASVLSDIQKDEPLSRKAISENKPENRKNLVISSPVDRFDLSYAFANNYGALGNVKEPLVEMTDVAKKYNVRCALVHPAEVEKLVDLLADSNTRPEALIDFPDGLGGVRSKIAQAEQAKLAGAVGGDLVVNLHAVQNRDRKTKKH